MPGGWLNHAEDSAHAIVRELQEEGGVTIEVEKLLLVATSELYPRLGGGLNPLMDGRRIPKRLNIGRFHERPMLRQRI